MTLEEVPQVNRLLKKEFKAHAAPIIELIEAQTHDPFCVLVGTILSARTKDQCTAGAVKRLFARMGGTASPDALEAIPVPELEKLIFPVGFYHDKARHLHALPAVLRERFGGVLPHTVEELCELPGVGRKTANLTVAVGFNLPAICVDVHVHRITNRWRLVKTKTAGPLLEDLELAPRLVRADALLPAQSELYGLPHQTVLSLVRPAVAYFLGAGVGAGAPCGLQKL